MANTKLTPEQKADLKLLKAVAIESSIEVVSVNERTTIAFKILPNSVAFSLSVMSPDEQKFRVKVGEYLALSRLIDLDQAVRIGKEDFYIMCENVWGFYP